MRRLVFTLAAVGLIALPDLALAQSRERSRDDQDPPPRAQRAPPRQDQAREDRRDGRTAPVSDVIRNVQQGRQGRRVDVRPNGSDYVVRWEYPDGRVRDIPVDGRTGRPRDDD